MVKLRIKIFSPLFNSSVLSFTVPKNSLSIWRRRYRWGTVAKKVKDQNDEMKSCGLLAHGLTRRKLTMNSLSVFERMMLAKKQCWPTSICNSFYPCSNFLRLQTFIKQHVGYQSRTNLMRSFPYWVSTCDQGGYRTRKTALMFSVDNWPVCTSLWGQPNELTEAFSSKENHHKCFPEDYFVILSSFLMSPICSDCIFYCSILYWVYWENMNCPVIFMGHWNIKIYI